MLYRPSWTLIKGFYNSVNKNAYAHNRIFLGSPKLYCTKKPDDKPVPAAVCPGSPGTPESNNKSTVPNIDIPGIIKKPDTDLYKRPVRGEAGKVIFGFIPQEWADAFLPKTGVTGFYTFLFTFGTFLASKEIYVMEHEYYSGISVAIMLTAASKLFGKHLAKFLDTEIDNYENAWNSGRQSVINVNTESIADEEKCQWSMDGQKILVEAKRENVGLQLEAAYRKRIVQVFEEVKKRLDYQVDVQNVQNGYVQKNIVSWVVSEVHKSLSPDVLDKYMEKCIEDLEGLVSKHKIV